MDACFDSHFLFETFFNNLNYEIYIFPYGCLKFLKIILNHNFFFKRTIPIHYKKVFSHREIKNGLDHIKREHEQLCEARLRQAGSNKSPEWSLEDVTAVLKTLKNGKSKDPYDIPNGLLKPGAAGDDLVLAITKLLNRIKTKKLIFPEPLKISNVTNIFKNKGLKKNFDSYRGNLQLQASETF